MKISELFIAKQYNQNMKQMHTEDINTYKNIITKYEAYIIKLESEINQNVANSFYEKQMLANLKVEHKEEIYNYDEVISQQNKSISQLENEIMHLVSQCFANIFL